MTELAIRGNFDVAIIPPLSEYAASICKTDFVPSGLRNRPEAVLACIMTGQELGIGPMQSLRQIYNFDGKTGLAAELMRALVLHHGHRLWFGQDDEFTTFRVVCYGVRADNGDDAKAIWTIDMAKNAGYLNKDNWKKSPRSMLAARASMEVCRMLFPDITAGMAYSAEELQDTYDPYAADDIVTEGEVVESRPKTKKRANARKPAATAPPQATAPIPEPPLPGEDEPMAAEAEPEQTPEQRQRSAQVVRLAKALGIDHHPVVMAVTRGVTQSASRLDARDASEVMNTLRAISEGTAKVQDRGDGVLVVFAVEPQDVDVDTGEILTPDATTEDDDIVDGEIVEEDEDANNPENWDADQWRAYLTEKGVKPLQVIKHSAKITAQGEHPVGNLQSIAGSGYAVQIKKFVDEISQ